MTQPRPPLPELISMLDAMPGPRILLDMDYHILAANQDYCDLFGVPSDLLGRTCFEVSHHFDKPCDQCGESCPRAQAMLTGQFSRVLHLHYTPNGREYVNVELTPIRGADRNIHYFIEAMTPLREHGRERPLSNMVGQSPAFKRMVEMIHRVAGRATSVLLLGESGTGKELAAQALHELSPRVGMPFVPVDCSGMSESLFESELFGHEKGAFTGANQRKTGLVEAACGGTLFLDELGDIPLNLQVKLLRLLETGSFRRVGSIESLKADFRLVAATHRDLKRMVEEGGFRRDLYFRIAAFPIHLPALRDRKEDLPLLARSILERLSPGKRVKLSAGALKLLGACAFPGNIRELRNILERALILSDGAQIEPSHLLDETADISDSPDGQDAIRPLEAVERDYLSKSLTQLNGNKAELAQRLGISRRTLDRKLRQE